MHQRSVAANELGIQINVPGADFTYRVEEYSAVRIHSGGCVTFNGSSSTDADECLDVTAYEEDVVVALCSGKLITLVIFNFSFL